jgi:hypothetical protein
MNLPAAPTMQPLVAWQNFYVIVGSSAGALIGLQFVVMAFVGTARKRVDADAINAFGTPIVVNFSAALALSAIMCAPWPTLFSTTLAVVACALAGLAYTAIAIRRACRQTHYRPIFEDWMWYSVLPGCAYAALTLGAISLQGIPQQTPFLIAGSTLGLLFIGIRNAWDTVTYIVISGEPSDTTQTQ